MFYLPFIKCIHHIQDNATNLFDKLQFETMPLAIYSFMKFFISI